MDVPERQRVAGANPDEIAEADCSTLVPGPNGVVLMLAVLKGRLCSNISGTNVGDVPEDAAVETGVRH
ncbi:MAG: hypothetical protein ACSLFB_12655 [Acidimicrobiales bacterium]